MPSTAIPKGSPKASNSSKSRSPGSSRPRRVFGPKDFAESYLIFDRRYIPWYAIALAILFFPIGLLALLIKNTANLLVGLEEESGQTQIKVDGSASRGVWRLIRDWSATAGLARRPSDAAGGRSPPGAVAAAELRRRRTDCHFFLCSASSWPSQRSGASGAWSSAMVEPEAEGLRISGGTTACMESGEADPAGREENYG